MATGMVLLVVIGVLIYLGFAQRILDKMRLTDRQAFLFIGAVLIGTFIPDIPITDNVGINIGGGVLPILLIGYLLVKADTVKEKKRAVTALIVATVVVYGATKIIPVEPTYNFFLDPMYIFALLAGIVGYLAGRSRRSAFIAGTGAMILTDVVSRIEVALIGGQSSLVIGGAGMFDGIIIAGLIAVSLAEIVGETREHIQRPASFSRENEHHEHHENQGEQEENHNQDHNPEHQGGE
ncbi:MAG: DUF1614 domain-containing protein [Candidatus Contubernalis sp.]|nr:DUF1614 domain-containing protein [Candidatus Contubernalis sp.]